MTRSISVETSLYMSRNRLTVQTQNVLEGSGTEVESLQDTSPILRQLVM